MVILILTLVLAGGAGAAKNHAVAIHSIEFKDSETCADAAVKWLKDMKDIVPSARPSALCVPKSK
jgi:hypothetical protein